MNTQPEALRLANALSAPGMMVDCAEIAAELRRLYAVNEELLGALKMIANLAHCPDNTMSDKDIARAAIEHAHGIGGEA